MLGLERIVFGLERLVAGGLLVAHWHRLAMNPAHPEGVAIGELGVDLDPFPALGPHPLGLLGELLAHHDVKKGCILQPAAVVLLEQVAQDFTPGLDVIVEPDELRPLV